MRKVLILLAGFVLSGVMYSQSNLPACPKDSYSFWTNCVGTLALDNGDQYVGEFKNDKRTGQGTYTYTNGNQYVGEYKDNKKHGQGTMTWTNGDQYVGEFKDHEFHGQGTMTWANGKYYIGNFINGELIEDYTDRYFTGNPKNNSLLSVEKNSIQRDGNLVIDLIKSAGQIILGSVAIAVAIAGSPAALEYQENKNQQEKEAAAYKKGKRDGARKAARKKSNLCNVDPSYC